MAATTAPPRPRGRPRRTTVPPLPPSPPAPPAPPVGGTPPPPPSDGQPLSYVYRFERGFTKNGVSANAVGSAIEFLRARDGVANARAFVDLSRPPTAETHPLFEWDDAVAAEQYRIVQARETIRELRVVPMGDDGPIPQGPVYVHVRQAQTPINGYAPAWVVVQRPDWSAQAKNECLAQLRGLQRRYQFLNELEPIWAAIMAFDAMVRGTQDDLGDLPDAGPALDDGA